MGKGFAMGLAEAGADVAVTDVNIQSGQLEKVCQQIKDLGRESIFLQTDISSQDEVKAMVHQVEKEFMQDRYPHECRCNVSHEFSTRFRFRKLGQTHRC